MPRISLWFLYDFIQIMTYRVLVGRLDGKRLLGISGRSWQDNIKVDF
jgi:hypothetical protein